MEQTIGILGGMGPEATALFYQQVVRLTPARNDQEHPRALILSDPGIPDRTGHLLEGGPSPCPALVSSVRRLEEMGADFIAIPCNTAHAFWAEMQGAVQIPVLNILEETARRAARELRSGPVGLLATVGTVRTELYQQALSRHGLEALVPGRVRQEQVQEAIQRIKGGDLEQALPILGEGIADLDQAGARGIILGCTELTLASALLETKLPLFDSSQILAAAAVRMAGKKSQKSALS